MSPPEPLIVRAVTGAQVRTLLPLRTCIEVIREAMIAVSAGQAQMPLRHGLRVPAGMLGMMYGSLERPPAFGIKLVSLFPGNAARGLSSHVGLYVLYEMETGRPLLLTDSGPLTAIRTAAASAVATAALARGDARRLAILGAGEQAGAHLAALPLVRSIERVRIWGRDPAKVDAFIAAHRHGLAAPLLRAESVNAAVADADIVCTVTSSAEPFLTGDPVRAGTHINLVGSSMPDRAEVTTDLVARSRYFVDYRVSTLAQAGEFLRARAAGAITDAHIVAEIGAVLGGASAGRRDDAEITIYKSLGIAAQDLAAAVAIWQAAEAEDIGQRVVL
jgi:ornithine cyclodeaminase